MRSLVVVPQADDWAQVAGKRLTSQTKAIAPLDEAVAIGVLPTYLEDDVGHDSKKTRDTVLQRLEQAREVADPGRAQRMLEDALHLANTMPTQVPERRNSVIRQVMRDLATLLFKQDPNHPQLEELFEVLTFRFDF